MVDQRFIAPGGFIVLNNFPDNGVQEMKNILGYRDFLAATLPPDILLKLNSSDAVSEIRIGGAGSSITRKFVLGGSLAVLQKK